MRIIKPDASELVQGVGFKGMLQHIEFCGRTCYKSEDKITEESCNKFVNMLQERAHGAMLEHGTVYLTIPENDVQDWAMLEESNRYVLWLYFMRELPYSKCVYSEGNYYITTNYRVVIENDLEDFMNRYWSECTDNHAKRRTFKITCNRGVSHEFVRHRVFSFAQESQRYVNYGKDKFGKEIKIIKPLYFEEDSAQYYVWKFTCENAERYYMVLLNDLQCSPQQAREVLPNSTATELIMTGFESDWEHFFDLRCAKDAHPQAQEIANMIREKF